MVGGRQRVSGEAQDASGRMKRLLVVGPLPPPVGGVESVTQAVLESGAVFAGFRVAHCDTTKRRPKESQGKWDFENVRWAMVHFLRMARAVYAFRPDVVYMPVTATWTGFWRDAVLAAIARLGSAKVVGHVHGGWFDRILQARGIRGWLVAHSLGCFDALLTLGQAWRRSVMAHGYRGRVEVMPSMCRRAVFEAAESFERDYERAGPPVGLYVGHVGRNKGVLDLLEAVARQRDRAARLIVVGPPQFEGDWECVLERHRKLNLVGRVVLTGPLQGEALYERFRMSDYLVLPSYWEGLPVVFLEAGAFGLPVIGTPVGAVPDLLTHGRNALLVPPGDIDALAAAIERLRHDAAERARLGRQLRADIRSYHPDVVSERIVALLEDELASARRLPITEKPEGEEN